MKDTDCYTNKLYLIYVLINTLFHLEKHLNQLVAKPQHFLFGITV